MARPKRLHLVCKDNLNVTERPTGIFVTGYWKLGADAALSVEFIYLHQTKDDVSYKQGKIVERYLVPFEGQQRYVFACEPTDIEPMAWKAPAAGEKGYVAISAEA